MKHFFQAILIIMAFNPLITSSRKILLGQIVFLKMATPIKKRSAHNSNVWRGRVPTTPPIKTCLGNPELTWKKSSYPGTSTQNRSEGENTKRQREQLEEPQLFQLQLFESSS